MADLPEAAPTGDAESTENKAKNSMSRREFARRAVVASAVASIAPTAAVTASAIPTTSLGGQTATQDAPPAAPQNPLPGAPKLSVESQSEADARFQAILVMYGARFSNEQKVDLHRLCAVVQPSLDHIREYKVGNGDGTALYLKPGFEREKKVKVAAPASGKSPASATPATKSRPASGSKKP